MKNLRRLYFLMLFQKVLLKNCGNHIERYNKRFAENIYNEIYTGFLNTLSTICCDRISYFRLFTSHFFILYRIILGLQIKMETF